VATRIIRKKSKPLAEPKRSFRPGDIISFSMDREKAVNVLDIKIDDENWHRDYVITRAVKGLDIFNFPKKSYILIPVKKQKGSELYKITTGKKLIAEERILKDFSKTVGSLYDSNNEQKYIGV